jgi:hypothetical protein
MWFFGLFGELGTIKYSPTIPFSFMMSWIESSVPLGIGFWRGNRILFACFMSGVLTLWIVLLGDCCWCGALAGAFVLASL